jgi:hypothetical protein
MNDVFNAVLLFAFAVVVWKLWARSRANSWPSVKGRTLSLKAYVERHPDCATGKGMRCAACGASSIKNWGFESADDPRRLFICTHCNTRLYWSEGA